MANKLYNTQVANSRVALKKGGFLKKVGKAAAGVGAAVLAAKGFRKKPAAKKKDTRDAVDKYFAKKGMSLKTGDASAAEAMAKSDRDKKIFRRGLDKIAAAGGVSKLKAGGKVKGKREKNPKHEQAERKSKIKKEYRNMGFGKMIDDGDFDFDKVSKMKSGGRAFRPVDKNKNPGLAKLPTKVRNKMGFMKKGGKVK
jgi:hypothetical protein